MRSQRDDLVAAHRLVSDKDGIIRALEATVAQKDVLIREARDHAGSVEEAVLRATDSHRRTIDSLKSKNQVLAEEVAALRGENQQLRSEAAQARRRSHEGLHDQLARASNAVEVAEAQARAAREELAAVQDDFKRFKDAQQSRSRKMVEVTGPFALQFNITT